MPFVELHASSAFSFLRGASSPEDLVETAVRHGMDSIAITDRDGLYGSARAHHSAKEAGGMRAIVGAELTLEDDSVLPVLVRTRTGYRNLCRLITIAKGRAAKGESRVLWSELPAFAEGLIALSGTAEGPVHRAEASEKLTTLQRLKDFFGKDNVAVELHRHLLPADSIRNRELMELAERTGLPLIASNAPAYAEPKGRHLLDAFTCLRHHTTLDEAGLLLAPNSQRYLKPDRLMRALFRDLPEAIDNTQRIADGIEFGLENLGYEFPTHPVPPGHSMDTYLREVTISRAKDRYQDSFDKDVEKQINKELGVISRLKFSGYFLLVWDIVEWCKANNVLVQGRGSAANSVVCYSLGITAADPIKYKLLFERFLTEESTAWPDIDLDLPSGDRRESVIQEVFRRFAPYGAAMTANVITYRGRSAMRDMGKVLGLPQDVMTSFSELFGHGDFPHTLELQAQLKEAGMPSDHPRLRALAALYTQVRGLPRHLGQHSGGMVLCTAGLDQIVPVEPATMANRKVVQWDKDDCEDLGIIKVDLLGLGMMAVLQDTMTTCKARGPQREIELHRLPPDDPATYDMVRKADTIGVFQIESRAQMATLPRMKPRCFYDLVIEVAIIRPGPIVGKMVHPYLKRRAGKEKIEYITDAFQDTLERTLGIPLFQEQVLKMSMIIADFTGGQADELRRAISFNRSDKRMNNVLGKLRAAMQAKDVSPVVQDRVVQSIQSFALYGFPESHAISFALLAYASAWLRVHRLAEFTAALLNNQPMGFYSTSTLVRDAKTHGLKVLPVCVVHSAFDTEVVDDNTIRLGLRQLRGFSGAAAARLVVERDHQPFKDLNDFLTRARPARDERRVLAKSGALNLLGHDRRSALWAVEAEVVDDLFTRAAAAAKADPEPALLAPMTPSERLEADYQATSLTVGPHPMRLIRERLPEVWCASELSEGHNAQLITIAGMVICRQRPGTAKGHVFVSLEDETGIANAFVPSALFEEKRLVITQEPFLKITGRLQNQEGVISVYAQKVEGLIYDTEVNSPSHDFH